MKKLYFLLFFVFSSAVFAQKNKIVFDLKDEFKSFSNTNCLKLNTDDEILSFEMASGQPSMIKEFLVSIYLDGKELFIFDDYQEFKNTALINLLQSNNAFKKYRTISFQIKWKLRSNKKESQIITTCLENSPPSSVNQEKEYIEIPVSFATDRKDTKNTDLNERFLGERANVQYGRVVVTIPYTHTLGEIERPSYWKLEFSEDPNKHVTLQSLKKQQKENFFLKMKERIAKNGGNTFLFVHGYNVSFADAAMRTAQITFDLRFNGEPVFYSWPSQASTAKYTVDEANIEWSRYNIKHFLKDYLTKTSAKNIYLVAHSMGNRGLTKAIIELMNESPELKDKITEVILAAPDIDADVFKRDIAPQMVSKIKKPITLYVSEDDLALIASQKVHGNNRAGFAGENIVVVKGVETIDASGIDTSFLSHSYFATSSNLIKDIFDLMKSGKRATDRKTLEKVSKENVTYWKVKKNKN